MALTILGDFLYCITNQGFPHFDLKNNYRKVRKQTNE